MATGIRRVRREGMLNRFKAEVVKLRMSTNRSGMVQSGVDHKWNTVSQMQILVTESSKFGPKLVTKIII